jgi:hypothetical protein
MSVISRPRAFISYSHDSDQHKDWVRQLAERLTHGGVAVILDQWDTGPGHDVTAFMELSLASCDWVLIICTDEYVRKANTLKGGVGYERMIITAEVARDLETNKFIPILRGERSERLPSFLGARIYVDLRADEISDAEYERLLRSLHGAPKYTRPAVGPNPYAVGRKLAPEGNGASVGVGVLTETTMKAAPEWTQHWHPAVHEYCGNTLYLILLRFNRSSIFFRESVLEDLRQSLITDFKIFHLYSPWDILLRIWADRDSIETLRMRLAVNRDVNSEKVPAVLVVEQLQHMSDEGVYADAQTASKILQEISLAQLRSVQEDKELSDLFFSLKDQGILIDDKVRFDPERIQFFITISSGQQLDAATRARIPRIINREWPGIFNRSVYMTPGATIQAVLKGQADSYYAIHLFLRGITTELEGAEILTETMLVANCEPRDSKTIDFGRAEAHIIEKKFQYLVPRHSRVSLVERLKLQSLLAAVWPNLHEDKHHILEELIRAKAINSAGGIQAVLSLFFPPFESAIKRNLVAVIVKEYGSDWQTTLDGLKKKEKLEAKSQNQFVLGDLCKIYKRIVTEKTIIDIAPLSDDEFASVMDAAPLKRNEFAHGEEILREWDEWFSFCSKFVPIHHRLMQFIENLQTKK